MIALDLDVMNLVAAHGSTERSLNDVSDYLIDSGCLTTSDQEFNEVVDSIVLNAARLIIQFAPERIQHRFDLACAHHLLRNQLVDAVKNNSSTLIIEIQKEITRMLSVSD